MSPRIIILALLGIAAAVPAGAESFKSWAARGAREERVKDPKSAAASYGNALSLWKDDDGASGKAKVLCARSAIRDKDGDAEGALSDLTACLAIDKKNAKGFHRRGQMYAKSGNPSQAISDFYKAVALDINFGQAYLDRAGAYESQGEKEFAGEDYRRACDLGVKAACAKAKSYAKPGKKKSKSKSKPKEKEEEKAAAPDEPKEAEKSDEAAEEAPAAEPAAEPTADAAPAPEKKKKAKSAASSYYLPKYRDCLDALNACVDGGDSFGTCVHKAPNCDKKAVKGCCPAACFKTYQKAINRDRSEAEAFRDNFAPDAACGVPPKAEEDD